MRIVTEYQTVPFYMCGDLEIHTFLQSRKIKYIEERYSTKSNKPYWVYESNEKLRLALKEYYSKIENKEEIIP